MLNRLLLLPCAAAVLALAPLSSAQTPLTTPAAPVPATITPATPVPATSTPATPAPVLSIPAQPASRLVASLDPASVPNFLPEAPSLLHEPAAYTLQTSSIVGTVQDPSGVVLPGAIITLITSSSSGDQPHTNTSATDGSFRFTGIPAGPFRLTISAPGLEPWITSGTLRGSDPVDLGEIALSLLSANAAVTVSASRTEVAQAQLQLAEKQRILGVFPNFYASYVGSGAEPLSPRQKFQLAWRFSVDPTSVAMAAVVAGSESAGNTFSGYGKGPLGYTRRLGATYADGFSSTMLGQAILPTLFHQDPRYFVKGTGSLRSRTWYALRSTLTCQGDNGRTQLNISNIAGNLASAGISNLYYPASDRRGFSLTLQNSLISTSMGALGNLMQEFVLRHMTPNVPDYGSLGAN